MQQACTQVLTRIQAPDHYHHYGIWGPWTRTQIEGRQVDFWNLADGQGTVLFKEFLAETQGDIFSGFTALQEHIDFGATDQNKIAINDALGLITIKIVIIAVTIIKELIIFSTDSTTPLIT